MAAKSSSIAILLLATSACCLVLHASAFSTPASIALRGSGLGRASMRKPMGLAASTMQMERRDLIKTASLAALALGVPVKSEAAGLAFGYGTSEKDLNAQLSAFGLSPFDKTPGGFKPLIQTVGGQVAANIDGSKTIDSIGSLVSSNGGLKAGERLLVLFHYPGAWIVNLPIVTPNGESGTVSANNYVKGDSAVVCAKGLEKGKTLDQLDKKFFQDLITQTIPNNGFESFKVIKKTPGKDIDGQKVLDLEFRFDLITGGPTIGRHGFAKLIVCGPNVVALSVTTTDGRFKGQKEGLQVAANSFRAHVVKEEFALDTKQGVSIGGSVDQ